MKKILRLLTFILFLSSCASEKKVEQEKIYSADTNRTFEMIERGGYLKKAPVYNAPPQIEQPRKTTRRPPPPAPVPMEQETKVEAIKEKEDEIFTIDEKINYQEKSVPQERSMPQTKGTQSKKTDERLIEINQNLAFYCMKQRKNPAYGGDEAKCLKFVEKVQKNCQAKNPQVNSKLLNCIRSGLKKR